MKATLKENFPAILIWMLFLASLPMPMESHTLPGPCTWPCLYPFTYIVWDNTVLYILSPFLLPIYLLSDLKTALAFSVYALIGMGELIVFALPFLGRRIRKPRFKTLLLTCSGASIAAIAAYAWFPSLRYGVDDLMIGYHILALTFTLAFVYILYMTIKRNTNEL